MNRSFAICRNCRHWRDGAPSDMRMPVERQATQPDYGACEIGPASMFEMNGEWVAFQPITHATRSCADFAPRPSLEGEDEDDPDDDGGGEPHPSPDSDKIRRLFPHPPKPIAA